MSTIERLRSAIDPILSTVNELRGQENEDMRVRQEQEAAELTARHAQEAMDLAMVSKNNRTKLRAQSFYDGPLAFTCHKNGADAEER